MPAVSSKQRRLMAAARAYKRGEYKGEPSDKVKELAASMSDEDLTDFMTKEAGPIKKESALLKVARELSARGRARIKTKNFAVPSKAEGKEEKKQSGNYPIHDIEHARNALARVAQHGSAGEQSTVRAKVYAKYPSLKKSAAGGGMYMGAQRSPGTPLPQRSPGTPLPFRKYEPTPGDAAIARMYANFRSGRTAGPRMKVPSTPQELRQMTAPPRPTAPSTIKPVTPIDVDKHVPMPTPDPVLEQSQRAAMSEAGDQYQPDPPTQTPAAPTSTRSQTEVADVRKKPAQSQGISKIHVRNKGTRGKDWLKDYRLAKGDEAYKSGDVKYSGSDAYVRKSADDPHTLAVRAFFRAGFEKELRKEAIRKCSRKLNRGKLAEQYKKNVRPMKKTAENPESPENIFTRIDKAVAALVADAR